MKTITIEIENKIEELLVVLDKDAENLQKNLERLNDLRGFVIKRDNEALEKLLNTVRLESGGYSSNESQRQVLRKELASAIGCDFEQMKLSMLETILPEDKKNHVTEIRTKLQMLAEKLKREYLSTSQLLSECARFNSLLLNSILELASAETKTYGSKGFNKRQAGTAFMDVQF